MNILVTNDDGIVAEGIHKLVEALSVDNDVYVCAPKKQQSASSHGITISHRFAAEEATFPFAKMAISAECTPADCIKIGLDIFQRKGIEFDRIFSGINHGMNLGAISLYSGTVAAAVEGSLSGIPSIAMSVCCDVETQLPKHYGYIMDLAMALAKPDIVIDLGNGPVILSEIDTKHLALNINVPDISKEKIKGVKIVPLGIQEFRNWFLVSDIEDGHIYYRFSNLPKPQHNNNSNSNDIIASIMGYATITPILYDNTDYSSLEKLRYHSLTRTD